MSETTDKLIADLRDAANWHEWDSVAEQTSCLFEAAAARLEAIQKAWKHYQDTMTQSGGEDWVMEEAITGKRST